MKRKDPSYYFTVLFLCLFSLGRSAWPCAAEEVEKGGAEAVRNMGPEEIQRENRMLRAEVKKLRAENQMLRTQLIEGGAPAAAENKRAAEEEARKSEYRLSSTGVRHNKNCRYFNSKGRPCGKNDGRPCKKCGG